MGTSKSAHEKNNISSFGSQEITYIPRIVWIIVHLALVFIAAWLYFGNGYTTIGSWFGTRWREGNLARRVILFLCGVLLWVRMTFMVLYLLKRRFSWAEALPVTFATALYQLGFALFGAGQSDALGLWDTLGIGLVMAGSYFNTGSELARKKFKDNPKNIGQLYTKGLFRYTQHPNYFGDLVWSLGWAFLTYSWWALIIPAILGASFILFLIPALNSYLQAHYGEQFERWSRKTNKLIPFIY